MTEMLEVIALQAYGGPHDGGNLPVTERQAIIGSDPACDFVVTEPGIAGAHASVRLTDSHIEVRDLGSPSGTFVNGIRIDGPTLIGMGDEVLIGRTVFREVLLEGGRAEIAAATAAPALPQPRGSDRLARRRRSMILGGLAALVLFGLVVALVILLGGPGS